VLGTVNELVDSGEVESIFCLFRLKDGEVACTWSDQDQLALLGLLDIAHLEVLSGAVSIEER
jgi:hypothetical protein